MVGWSGNSGARYLCVWDMTVRAEAVRARFGARAHRCVRMAASGAVEAAVRKTTACGRRRRRRGDGEEATDSGLRGRDETVVRGRGELQSLSCAADPIARVESVLGQGARSY